MRPSIQTSTLIAAVARPVYLIIDTVGLIALCLSPLLPPEFLRSAAVVLGSALLTIGLTLPIGLHYQSQLSAAHFKILRSCEEAGIKSVFVSRSLDVQDIEAAIEHVARSSSGEIFCLGVAFPTLFDPSKPHTHYLQSRLRDYRTPLRVALLNPESPAASRRDLIEHGSPTLLDIHATLRTGIPSLAMSRLSSLMEHEPQRRQALARASANFPLGLQEAAEELAEAIGLRVRLYDLDPIAFILGFQTSMFVEQYHFGRAEEYIVPLGCIGKHVPVLQYTRASRAYAFLRAHFEYIWDQSADYAPTMVRGILATPEHLRRTQGAR